jgi:3-hydroxyisobutyryl-CoA hydrolase
VIGKSADRPAWSPSTVNDVRSEEITRNFFSRESPFLSEVPSLSIPGPFLEVQGQAPSRYALPTEKDIGVVVRGSASTSAGTGLTLDELVSQFDRKHNGKHGVKEKVLEVVQRGCDFVDNADENYQWLKWRH